MGAGLYPPPIDKTRPLGIVYYNTVGSTAYVGDTETRAWLATYTAAPGRLYRVTLNVAAVDADAVADVATTADHGAKNSCTFRARWAYGTDATVTSTDMGAFYQSVYDDDSMFGSGACHQWFIGSASLTPGPLSVAITMKATKAAATYGSVRVLTLGGNTTSLQIEDIGGYPTPNLL
ncbi:hypothetical protein SEA_VERSE_23 [Streptomyces phage Verse]|uniref:DUF7298 domain-containing protein n=2 Tax=Streptomyces phage Amela TaxID=1673877 RepID=A0A0K1YA47_9CAUD|nr:hypothetical protein AVT29_gp23 [Streptomyces phage Amela]AKY03778.1 hypothetical protein SEA_AMELA_23 [Streptomyces phage Amela]AKY03853.1 hypothetical protein SEA_VERSE_23 [Streptomyces phage Verse]